MISEILQVKLYWLSLTRLLKVIVVVTTANRRPGKARRCLLSAVTHPFMVES